jgi:predicted DNA binding CopG/RHH family protein
MEATPEGFDLLASLHTTPQASWLESSENMGMRARRKDATGKRDYHIGKRDRHKASATVAVRLPSEQVEQMRAAADAHGLSVNAWLAVAIQRELEGGKPPYGGLPLEEKPADSVAGT